MAWVGRTESKVASFPGGRLRSQAGWGGAAASDEVTRAFLQRVYLFMGLGLAMTGVVALLVASSPAALAFVFGNRLVYFGLIIAQLGLVVAFSARATRVSAGTAGLMFFSYAALSGVTFAAIFIRYTAGSIASTFFVTGGMFAALSFYGLVTRRNLDGLGSFAFMGLIGIVIASLVNIFLHSSMLYWLTTFAGVIVFTGLTIYDTAKLKALAGEAGGSGQVTQWALRGALTLYLDFINLFLMLLRLFGRRRE
jgi:FtsH-binding integral membrane protein